MATKKTNPKKKTPSKAKVDATKVKNMMKADEEWAKKNKIKVKTFVN